MKVINLLGSNFCHACEKLASKIIIEFNPDIIIGILTGGGYVAKEIQKALPQNCPRKYIEIKIQRVGTRKKSKKVIKTIFKYTPIFILNWMRILESLILKYKNNTKREGNIIMPKEIADFLNKGEKNILIVDDAIDSGATISLIKEYINNNYPSCIVKVAVITVTTENPISDADYYLYHDKTLIRFPWSNDVKK